MKKFILFLVLFLCTLPAFGQATLTPNVGFQIPAYQQTNWQVPIDYNFNVLDTLLGGTTGLQPGSATPPVSLAYSNYVTSNSSPVTITNFTGGFPGQSIRILCGTGDVYTTINPSSSIDLSSPWSCSFSAELGLTLVNGVWIGGGGASTTLCAGLLAANQVVFGTGVGTCASSPNFTWNSTTRALQIAGFAGSGSGAQFSMNAVGRTLMEGGCGNTVQALDSASAIATGLYSVVLSGGIGTPGLCPLGEAIGGYLVNLWVHDGSTGYTHQFSGGTGDFAEGYQNTTLSPCVRIHTNANPTEGQILAFHGATGSGRQICNEYYTANIPAIAVTYTILYSAAGTPVPTCNTGEKGVVLVVSDATTPSYLGAYVSGGAAVSPALCNGTNWVTY